MKVGAAHKKKFEVWLAGQLADAQTPAPAAIARQIVLLLEGAFSIMLIHKDPAYIEEAGRAARALVMAARA